MILSEERISHIAHQILDSVAWKEDWVDFSDEGKALRITKKIITSYCESHDKAIQEARERLDRQKTVVPGSPEWDILLEKYVQAELKKKGFGREPV